ncbi:MAG: hypothetical protein DRO36_07355, partial [Candidatus Hecatellales archaeon]
RIDMEMWDLAVFSGYSGLITVEHILPVSPSEDSEWIRKFDENARKKWTNKLGNLVLLSGPKNSKASNYDFERKKDAYFKEKCTPFRLTQEIFKYKEWNLATLQQRHEDLISKVESIYLPEKSFSINNFL